jgi:hypothetical protein
MYQVIVDFKENDLKGRKSTFDIINVPKRNFWGKKCTIV